MKNYLIFILILFARTILWSSSLPNLVKLAYVIETEEQISDLYDRLGVFLDSYNSVDAVIQMWKFMYNNHDIASLIFHFIEYEPALDKIITNEKWTGRALKILLSDLHIKNIENNFNAIKLLVKANGGINKSACAISSLLDSDNIKILKMILLIANGNINIAIGNDGNVPLYISIKEKLPVKFIEFLFKLDADWDVESFEQESSLDLVLQKLWASDSRPYCFQIIAIMRNYGFEYTDLNCQQFSYMSSKFFKRYILNFDNFIMLWFIFCLKNILTQINEFQK